MQRVHWSRETAWIDGARDTPSPHPTLALLAPLLLAPHRVSPIDACFVAIPARSVTSSEPPQDIEWCLAAASRPARMFAVLMMCTAEAELIPTLVAPLVRAIEDVVVFDAHPRRATWSFAAPAGSRVNGIPSAAREALRVVPGVGVFLEQRKQSNPRRGR
jgi:hypothetical protein